LSSYFFAGSSFQIAQNDDRPVFVWQAAQLLIEKRLEVAHGLLFLAALRQGDALLLTPVLLCQVRSQPDSCLMGNPVKPVGDVVPIANGRGLPDKDKKGGLKGIFGIVMAAE
jgi:hypothetical protein